MRDTYNGFTGLDAQMARAAEVLIAQRKAWAKKLLEAQQPAASATPSRWMTPSPRRMVDVSSVQRIAIANARGSRCACGTPTTAMVSAGAGSWECVCARCEGATVERLTPSTVARRRV